MLLTVNDRSPTLEILFIPHTTTMSRDILSKEARRELDKLNDTIDRKILKGLPYKEEARRHKELIATLRRITEEQSVESGVRSRRTSRRGSSPVRKTFRHGILARLYTFGFAV